MNAPEDALFGECGKRTEVVQWGLRKTVGDYLQSKGEVAVRPSEEAARDQVGNIYDGWRNTEVVKRTIVTYTGTWETTSDD